MQYITYCTYNILKCSNTDDFLITYEKPNRFYKDKKFPVNFDNDCGLSRGLLFEAFDQMGFKNIHILDYTDTWLPKKWVGSQAAILACR